MAQMTRAELRERLGKATGFFYSGKATGSGTTTSLEDTQIQRYDAGRLKNKWLYIVSASEGDLEGVARRISSVSGSTITVVAAFVDDTKAPAVDDTYEILEHDPLLYHDATAQSLRTLYPGDNQKGLWRRVIDESIIVDNLLYNSSFEDGASSAWTATAGTWTFSNSLRRMHGRRSAFSNATSSASQLSQDIFAQVNIRDMVGKTLRVRGWIFSNTASSTRFRVTFDGSTFVDGSYHPGSGEWVYDTSLNVVIPEGATEMTVYCEVANGEAYFDLVAAWIERLSRYPMSNDFAPSGPHQVWQQRYEDSPEGPYEVLQRGISGRLLRLEGMGPLTVPEEDGGTTEVDDIEGQLVVAEAAYHLYRRLAAEEPGSREQHLGDSRWWQNEASNLRNALGRPGMSAHSRDWWRMDDGDPRRIVLTR